MNLKEVKVGETVTIKKVTGTGPVKRRIMELEFLLLLERLLLKF